MSKQSNVDQCIQKAIDIARHAPSSHNCQPWSVNRLDSIPDSLNIETFENSHFITISFDSTRVLNSLPSLTREMYTSCGIFSALLVKALVCMGYQCDEHWQDKNGLILLLHILPKTIPDKISLDQLQVTSSKRLTNRGVYQDTKINASQYVSLMEGAKKDVITCQLINDPNVITNIAQLIQSHAGLDFSNRKVWQETYGFIRFNENKTVEDGFYMRNLFGPVSWIFTQTFKILFHPKNHWLSKIIGLPNYMAKGLAELVHTTPQIIALTAKSDSNLSCWLLGKELASLWLKAQEQGLSFHPLSVLLQNEIPRKKLTQLLSYEENVLFIARLGIAQSPASRAPRREVSSILN